MVTYKEQVRECRKDVQYFLDRYTPLIILGGLSLLGIGALIKLVGIIRFVQCVGESIAIIVGSVFLLVELPAHCCAIYKTKFKKEK